MNSSTMTQSQLMSIVSSYSFIIIAILVLTVIAWWKLFKKAGQPGIFSLIPILNTWTLFKISGIPPILSILGWVGSLLSAYGAGLTASSSNNTVALGGVIAMIAMFAIIISAIASFVLNFKLAKRFGKGFAFGLGLLFFNTIFIMILAFDSSVYREY